MDSAKATTIWDGHHLSLGFDALILEILLYDVSYYNAPARVKSKRRNQSIMKYHSATRTPIMNAFKTLKANAVCPKLKERTILLLKTLGKHGYHENEKTFRWSHKIGLIYFSLTRPETNTLGITTATVHLNYILISCCPSLHRSMSVPFSLDFPSLRQGPWLKTALLSTFVNHDE